MQEAHEAVLLQNNTQHTSTIQQLTVQLREKEERLRENEVILREMEESHRQREGELLTQLRHKDIELEQKIADISRLRGNADICRFQDHVEVSVAYLFKFIVAIFEKGQKAEERHFCQGQHMSFR